MSKASDNVLFERERAAGQVTRLSLGEFMGHVFIDLRNYYRSGEQLLPSKQGITLNSPELAEEVSGVLLEAAERMRKSLASKSNKSKREA